MLCKVGDTQTQPVWRELRWIVSRTFDVFLLTFTLKTRLLTLILQWVKIPVRNNSSVDFLAFHNFTKVGPSKTIQIGKLVILSHSYVQNY